MKKRILISAIIMASVLCLASCSDVKPDTSTSTPSLQSSEGEEYIPEKDADGNKIEVVEVTDAQGEVVVDDAGKAVTELNIVDEKGAVITDAEGNKAKPNIPSNPAKASPSASNSGGNGNASNNSSSSNNSNNSNSSNNSSNSNNTSNNSGNSNNNSSAADNVSLISFMWFGDSEKVDDQLKFTGVEADTDIMEITFKVKDNAPDGKTEIKEYSSNGRSTSFCDDEPKDIPIEISTGVIGINEEVSETASGSGFSFVISSASAKPGDTVTLKCSLKNVTKSVAAFNSNLSYDSDVLEAVSVKKIGFVETNGEFSAKINP